MGHWFPGGCTTKKDLIRAIKREYPVLRSCIRGSSMWAVVKGETQNVIIEFKLVCYDGWGYKPISEDMGPFNVSCPLGYLNDAPVACESWRYEVRKYHGITEEQLDLFPEEENHDLDRIDLQRADSPRAGVRPL